jgi:hypothetical protein
MSRFFESAFQGLSYLMSLPERTIRSMAAVAGGTTSLLTDTLFPEALKGTTLYKVFLGDTQRFIIEKVAMVQREAATATPAEAAQPDDYVQRKMMGSALEAAGLLAMHFSPLWVLAIAGDAAAGSGEFLQRLVVQLKKNNVIPPDAEIAGLADLLTSIQETSRRSAAAVDTPPLSREEVSKLAAEMTDSYRSMFSKAGDLLPRFETLWKRMEDVARRENISLERLGGILTVDVAAWGKKGIGTVLAVSQTGADLFGEKILASYDRTLDAVADQGVTGYLSGKLKPFFQAAAAHFDPSQKTWTESWFTRTPAAAAAAPPSAENTEEPPLGCA